MIVVLLFLYATGMSIAFVSGMIKEEDNIVVALDEALAYYERDSIRLEDVKKGRVYDNDTASRYLSELHQHQYQDEYVRYCMSASYYLRRDYRAVLELLGSDWHCAESSFLQIESARAMGDTSTIGALLTTLIENQPDVIESDYMEELVRKDSQIVAESIQKVRKELQSKEEDVVAKARLAKIEMSLGNISRAETLLVEVTRRMPNLSRPWCYLACVRIAQGDSSCVDTLLSRARALGFGDNISVELSALLV